jgi:uncharacterized protein YjiS (DUF1127 family)
MQNLSPQAAAALPRVPAFHRASSAAAMLRTLVGNLSILWDQYRERQRGSRELRRLADMDAHVLKDIGAPEWMVARAQDRADAYRRHADALYPSRASID